MIGKTKHGTISVTEGQRKKHFSQMKDYELDAIKSMVSKIEIEKFSLSYHFRKKLAIQIQMPILEIARTIARTDSKIIEYNTVRNDKRVLLKSKKSYQVMLDGKKQKANICIVISLIDNKVITGYYNSVDDKHKTIRMNRYDASLKIV